MRSTVRGSRHYIYTLTDPRDNTVRYVGVTIDPISREGQHRSASRKTPMGRWIAELKALGLSPVLDVAEVIDDGKFVAYDREAYWIRHYHAISPLLNRREAVNGWRKQILLDKSERLEILEQKSAASEAK